MPSAAEIIESLGLAPLKFEGGYYNEVYRSVEMIPAAGLPARYGGDRCFATSIYYLLTGPPGANDGVRPAVPETFSRLHRVASDEVFHFYLGDAVTMLWLEPDGASRTLTLGSDLAAGQRPQVVVPRGVWQGCRLADGGRVALMGCTVAPGFELADCEPADREEMIRRYPDRAELIRRLTPA